MGGSSSGQSKTPRIWLYSGSETVCVGIGVVISGVGILETGVCTVETDKSNGAETWRSPSKVPALRP